MKNLSPKTNYKVTVTPVYKSVSGSSKSVTITTIGNKLSKVKGLKVDYSKKENKATVSWQAFPDNSWVYGVYYGISTVEISNTRNLKLNYDLIFLYNHVMYIFYSICKESEK